MLYSHTICTVIELVKGEGARVGAQGWLRRRDEIRVTRVEGKGEGKGEGEREREEVEERPWEGKALNGE